jgi:hypothetical protein
MKAFEEMMGNEQGVLRLSEKQAPAQPTDGSFWPGPC